MNSLVDIAFTSSEVPNPIDFKEMVKKTYVSFQELMEDVGWFVHHCLTKYSGSRSIVTAAKSLKNLFEVEIYNLCLCSQCYLHANEYGEDSFPVLCDPPHLLLWVDCKKYGFWPAKLMRLEEDNIDNVTVRYFGEYTNSTINVADCLLYSEDIPGNDFGNSVDSAFRLARSVS